MLDELIIMAQFLGVEGVKSGPVTACRLVEACAHFQAACRIGASRVRYLDELEPLCCTGVRTGVWMHRA